LGWDIPEVPIIDRLAPHGDAEAVKFQTSQIKHADRRDHTAEQGQRKSCSKMTAPHFDFSYSGIKTAVLRYVEMHDLKPRIEASASGARCA
jgi:N6-L-threonylcarbamoyladenine synthase